MKIKIEMKKEMLEAFQNTPSIEYQTQMEDIVKMPSIIHYNLHFYKFLHSNHNSIFFKPQKINSRC